MAPGLLFGFALPQHFDAHIQGWIDNRVGERAAKGDFPFPFSARLLLKGEIRGPIPTIGRSFRREAASAPIRRAHCH